MLFYAYAAEKRGQVMGVCGDFQHLSYITKRIFLEQSSSFLGKYLRCLQFERVLLFQGFVFF